MLCYVMLMYKEENQQNEKSKTRERKGNEEPRKRKVVRESTIPGIRIEGEEDQGNQKDTP